MRQLEQNASMYTMTIVSVVILIAAAFFTRNVYHIAFQDAFETSEALAGNFN